MLTLWLHNPWKKVSDALPRRGRNARLLKIVVDRFADVDVAAAVADADAEVVDAAVKDDAW